MAGDSGVIQLGIMWIVTGSRQRVRKSSRPESLPPPQLFPWECNGATDGSNLWDQTRPYEIVSPLGGGSMGEVCRARDPRLNLEVTIKVFIFGAIAFGGPNACTASAAVRLRCEEGYREEGAKRAVRVSRMSHLPSRLTHDLEGMTIRFHRGAVVLGVNESDLWVEEADVLDFKPEAAVRIGRKIQFLFDRCMSSRHLARCQSPNFGVLCVERRLSASVAPLPRLRVSCKLCFDCRFVPGTDRLSLRHKSGRQDEDNCRTATVHDHLHRQAAYHMFGLTWMRPAVGSINIVQADPSNLHGQRCLRHVICIRSSNPEVIRLLFELVTTNAHAVRDVSPSKQTSQTNHAVEAE